MQSKNGGLAAWEPASNYYWLEVHQKYLPAMLGPNHILSRDKFSYFIIPYIVYFNSSCLFFFLVAESGGISWRPNRGRTVWFSFFSYLKTKVIFYSLKYDFYLKNTLILHHLFPLHLVIKSQFLSSTHMKKNLESHGYRIAPNIVCVNFRILIVDYQKEMWLSILFKLI